MATPMQPNAVQQPISERQLLESKYNHSRANLLWVVLFTAINIVLLVSNGSIYFLFSAFIPYFSVDLGMFLCGKYPEEVYVEEFAGMQFLDNSFFVVTLVIGVVLTLLYLLSWFLSKNQKVGWMIFALIFFAVDTAAMFAMTGFALDSIVDILFHGWVIFSLISGIIAHFKWKKLPPDEPLATEVPVLQEDAQTAVAADESQSDPV